jgi:hypothetical protein
MPRIPLDLTGRVVGRLTVIAPVGRTERGAVLWSCQCACGTNITAIASNLKQGSTASCGCLPRELKVARNIERSKHGLYNTAEYHAWECMVQRCYNPNRHNFRYWGGRGITICPEWRNSFEAFLAHIGPKPSPIHTVDRFPDNAGDYRPGNVRWATPAQQAENRREARHAS